MGHWSAGEWVAVIGMVGGIVSSVLLLAYRVGRLAAQLEHTVQTMKEALDDHVSKVENSLMEHGRRLDEHSTSLAVLTERIDHFHPSHGGKP